MMERNKATRQGTRHGKNRSYPAKNKLKINKEKQTGFAGGDATV